MGQHVSEYNSLEWVFRNKILWSFESWDSRIGDILKHDTDVSKPMVTKTFILKNLIEIYLDLISHKFRHDLKCSNFLLSKGLVKISTTWLFVSTNSKEISSFWTWSLNKWCFISICLVLAWNTGFLDRAIVLVLSHLICILSKWMP